ncbi:MAG: type IV pilin protein [Solimonas sp.]
MRSKHPARGFTLIELMIALSVATILAVIAVSSYRSTILRSNRQLASRMLVDLAAKQEDYKIRHRSYANGFDALVGIDTDTLYVNRAGKLGAASAADSRFKIEIDDATASSYTLLATAVNDQSHDASCQTWSLTHLGIKSATGGGTNPVKDCWGG